MLTKAEIRAESARLSALFLAAGAEFVGADVLQPADVLLDLYGEDIRARAFVTHDPLNGELMLRPDFTVPVALMHMNGGAEPARYTYSGKVFRRQETGAGRASEYLQVGYEVFDRDDPAAADAEVFALFRDAIGGLGLRAATGDIGILKAAVQGLKTTARRKSALLRHIWRPRRFSALLDRFGGISPAPPSRLALLASPDPLGGLPPLVGLRSIEEIGARISALHEDANEPHISAADVGLLDQILGLRAKLPVALERLHAMAAEFPSIAAAVDCMSARANAFAARGVDVGDLDFEGSYGRTSMEYYDGFVFGFYAEGQPSLPPIATGGRYDALTRELGQGSCAPAVGGVIRPGMLLQLKERLS